MEGGDIDMMQYNTEIISKTVIREIKYFLAVSALRKMRDNNIITPENYMQSVLTIANKYRVLRYDI